MLDTRIPSLGPCEYRSPLAQVGSGAHFKTDAHRILVDNSLAAARESIAKGEEPASFEVAGPREQIFFDPARTTAGIVTCGGLCPGLNDVIRGLVTLLHRRYGVTRTYGFRFGYEGLVPTIGHVPMTLRPESVEQIPSLGGTILGTSRGPQNIGVLVDTLEEMKIDLLFVVGGDGSLRGAAEIGAEAERRGLKKAIVGIPKTIDNDIMFLDKSFGFETAFAAAVTAINCAHTEALGSPNGIGLVKLMGRDSGFIACFAALASASVNFVLIPEVPFDLHGGFGLLEALRYRLAKRKHAVIVVAEGAGQDLLATDAGAPGGTDASGNKRYGDIGAYLKTEIEAFFKSRKIAINLKFIDPSYTIRSVPAAPQDNVYCSHLAHLAVHAAMAGKTRMLVGRWHGTYVHLPLHLVTQGRRKVSPDGDLWHSVLDATSQPPRLR